MKSYIPKLPPENSEFLFTAEWAFSPGSSRQDILYISKDKTENYWLLWSGWFDDNYLQNVIECIEEIKVEKKRNIKEAAFSMVVSYWNNEHGLPEPEFVMETGLFVEEDIDKIVNNVWKNS